MSRFRLHLNLRARSGVQPRAQRSRFTPWGVAMGLGVALASGIAHAGPDQTTQGNGPPGDAFDLRYFLTDANGDESTEMKLDELQRFFNRARCQCGQDLRVRLQLRNTGATYDEVRLTPFFGQSCDDGQENVSNFRPCLQDGAFFPRDVRNTRRSWNVDPIWLAHGTLPGGQTPSTAKPAGTCQTGIGAGGFWLCSDETGRCFSDTFIVTPDMHSNLSGQTGTPTGMEQPVSYDFEPPVAPPSNIQTEAGDSAVRVTWDLASTGDISGFRVLCATADDEPVAGKGETGPSPTARPKGTIYFTEQNLCPDGPFTQGEDDSSDTDAGDTGFGTTGGDPDGTTGDGTGGGTDGGTTGGGTGGALPYIAQTTSGTGGSSGTGTGGTGGTSTGGTGTGTGTGTGGTGTTGGVEEPPLPTEGIESLQWAYVCSGHVGANTTSVRVSGLENDVEYRFILVAYDEFGNPAASEVFTETPVNTLDLWEQCSAAGDICGDGGFCSCSATPHPGRDTAFLGLAILWWARRRRTAPCP